METVLKISGKIVDVVNKEIYSGTIHIEKDRIVEIVKEETSSNVFILPGLIDSHIHIESSMLVPSEFARLAVVHGTVATVSDPHEIANVMGMKGVEYMIENARKVPVNFWFGAPSCVPATPFESSGAEFGLKETEELLSKDEIKYMAEMMNFPGVVFDDDLVHGKLAVSKKYNKPIDGHAPGLAGKQLQKYAESGITTDHECFSMEEALEKISHGMKIQIREGSAARNFEALKDLFDTHPGSVMLCSDDKHPDELLQGHLNILVKRAINLGFDPIRVLDSCTRIPSEHYNLNAGLLQKGDRADLIVVDSLEGFNVQKTYIGGELVAENGKCLFERVEEKAINVFNAEKINPEDLIVKAEGSQMRVMEALDGELITKERIVEPKVENGRVVTDLENDILKIVVLNRYRKEKPSVAFIKNFGLKKGAIASTVAHDSHNIIAVGTDDLEICNAINEIIKHKGGISASNKGILNILPLPVAGIMTTESGRDVAVKYEKLDGLAKELGCKLKAPFMTLAFMALLVIPELKISDKGLFNGVDFNFCDIFTQ
jgi:adenine deaminase